MDRRGHSGDALALALLVAALAFGVHGLAAHAGLTVARQAAVLQAALWGVVAGLLAWHWWHRWRPRRRPPGGGAPRRRVGSQAGRRWGRWLVGG